MDAIGQFGMKHCGDEMVFILNTSSVKHAVDLCLHVCVFQSNV